jgi:hypothetical protein
VEGTSVQRKLYSYFTITFFVIIIILAIIPLFIPEKLYLTLFSEYGALALSVVINIGCGIFTACLFAWIIENIQTKQHIQDVLFNIDVKMYTIEKLMNAVCETHSITFVQTVQTSIWDFSAWYTLNPLHSGINKTSRNTINDFLDKLQLDMDKFEKCNLEIMQLDTLLRNKNVELNNFQILSVQTAKNVFE